METIDYLKDLFTRMSDNSLLPGTVLPEGVKYSSKDSVSWKASREFDTLKERKYLLPLKELIVALKDSDQRRNAFRLLIRIGDLFEPEEIGDLVLGKLKKEKTRLLKDFVLNEFTKSKLAITKEAESVLEFAKNKDWQIRHPAFSLLFRLDKTHNSDILTIAEDGLEKYRKAPYDLMHIINLLGKYGNKNHVPILREIVTENSDQKPIVHGVSAIEKLAGKEEFEFYLETYQAKKERIVKVNIFKTLIKHGNENLIDPFIKRGRAILARPRKRTMGYSAGFKPEIVNIFIYLLKYNDPRIDKFKDWVLYKKKGNLDATELTWVEENIL